MSGFAEELPELDAQLDGLMVIGAAGEPLMLSCEGCSSLLCAVEDGDTLAVLVRVAVDHVRECVGFG